MAPTLRFATLALPLGLASLLGACTPATPPTLVGTGMGDAAATAPASPAPGTTADVGASAGASLGSSPAPAAPSPAPSQAPMVRFLGLDGQEKGLEAFSGVRVVTFWATWCGHCQAELPLLDPWAKAEARPGWAWVPVEASQGSKEEVAKFKTDYKIQSELYFDPSGAVAQAFNVNSYPTTIVLDAQGAILFRKSGQTGPEAFQPYLPAK